MDEREQRKRKERSDLIWTFIIIGGFLAAWPIGLVLAVLRGRGLLPDLGMNTPTRQESWRNFQVNSSSGSGHKPGAAATNWSAQAQEQAERTRRQAQYWAEQARVQAERTRQRAVQWAVPVHTQRTQQTNPTPAQQAQRAQQNAARQQAAQNAAREQAAREGFSEMRTDALIHGDYCLPNIILKDWKLSGYIDVGNGGLGDRHIDILWGIWTLKYNLKTTRYTERFMDAYGRDLVEPEKLRCLAAMEMIGG